MSSKPSARRSRRSKLGPSPPHPAAAAAEAVLSASEPVAIPPDSDNPGVLSPKKKPEALVSSWIDGEQKMDKESPAAGVSSGEYSGGWEESMKRLEKLRVCDHEEIELSEEQIRDNDRRQEDEVLALEAIYQDNILIFTNQGGQRSFQIFVQYEILDGMTVSAKFLSDSNTLKTGVKGDTKDEPDNGFLYSFKVQYLPPILLTCLMPNSYPSHRPPYFTLNAQWLDRAKLSSLSRELDLIWNEQFGQEVVFQWIEWLHNSYLSHLGFDNNGVVLSILDGDDVAQNGDDCAVSANVLPEYVIPFMINYNEEKCQQAFLRNLHMCEICYSEYTGTEFVKLPCQHFFCTKCMETYSKMHVKEGTVTKLSCLSAKCGGWVPPAVLKRLLDDTDYKRWESLLLQRTLDSMSDVVYCPRCETACLEDQENNDAQCSKCFFSFCSVCMERRHVGEQCMSPEQKIRILEARQKSSTLGRDQIRKERDMINELLSLEIVKSTSKQCPTCKMAIEKNEGCNKMVCRNCGQFFCYNCNQSISGYDHFQEEKCQLFPREEIIGWEQQMNQQMVLQQINRQMVRMQAQVFGHRGHPCPHCRQPNFKEGNNNHLVCRACQTRYCALCQKVVRRSSEHFTPKGCKQHTADP